MIDAIQRSLEDPSRLIPSYALLSRIRLSSSTNVVESAEQVLTTILNTYSQPNLTLKDIQSMALGARTRCTNSATSVVMNSNHFGAGCNRLAR